MIKEKKNLTQENYNEVDDLFDLSASNRVITYFYIHTMEYSSAWMSATLGDINELGASLSDMTPKKTVQPRERVCGLCTKQAVHLAEFNDRLLCARCFDHEITSHAENGSKFKLRVAIA
jgi:hypothetical protein